MRERLTDDQWKQRFIGAYGELAREAEPDATSEHIEAEAEKAYAEMAEEGIDTEDHCPVESARGCFIVEDEEDEADEQTSVEGAAV